MRELKVINVKGNMKIGSIKAYDLLDNPQKQIKDVGISKEEFFSILDKASRPIKSLSKSDSKQS